MKQKIVTILSVIVIVIMIVFNIKSENKPKVTADSSNEEVEVLQSEPEIVFVELKGAINSPGVYSFTEGTRLFEAIDAAGGLSEDANIDYLNRTRILEDQTLVIILTNAEIQSRIDEQLILEHEQSVLETVSVQTVVEGADDCSAVSSQNQELVSINNASASQLETLPGIGESKANDIILYRTQNNGFTSIDELLNVNGIGQATLDKIKEFISL